jgi:magnesium chelatase subunit I
VRVPDYIKEIVEQLAFPGARGQARGQALGRFAAAADFGAGERGVERGAAGAGARSLAVPRVLDIYSALPSITGKMELEYEGELKGGDAVARELIRVAVGKVYTNISKAPTCRRSCSGSIWEAR